LSGCYDSQRQCRGRSEEWKPTSFHDSMFKDEQETASFRIVRRVAPMA
jgi:hypothetical protein